MRKNLGDFQTPITLASEIVSLIQRRLGPFERVLEPTCGSGSFVRALTASATPPSELWGLEIQGHYVDEVRALAGSSRSTRITVLSADIFRFPLRSIEWASHGRLLVVGNPPWALNADLSARGSGNLPEKSNLKGLRGIDAITGGANFDVAEYIWLKLLRELAHESPTIALLCKTSVARNVLRFAKEHRLPLLASTIWRVDAKKWFDVAADACVFATTLGSGPGEYEADVFPSIEASSPEGRFGFVDGHLVPDVRGASAVTELLSGSPFEWRQGVKHDAAPVLELRSDGGLMLNGLGEAVDVESDRVFPLVKGGDVFHGRDNGRSILLPQLHPGEDSTRLRATHPRLWNYLSRHSEALASRKSSIYRGRSPFAIFGIGPYSFARFKVAVSGLHKGARFLPVGPRNARPVLFDDTTYFLPANSAGQCAALAAILNSTVCQQALGALVFWDMKRPITKAVLGRLNISALAARLPESEWSADFARALGQLELSTVEAGHLHDGALHWLLSVQGARSPDALALPL